MGSEELDTALKKLEAEIESLTAAMHKGKVIGIRKLRALGEMRTRCQLQAALLQFVLLLEELARSMFLFYGRFLLEFLRIQCPSDFPGGDEDVLAFARSIAKDTRFQRLNQKVRLSHAEYCYTPCANVREHTRAGRRVRATCRYLGNQHLLDLPLERESPNVVRLVRCLANLHTYYEWPRGRTRMDTKSGR